YISLYRFWSGDATVAGWSSGVMEYWVFHHSITPLLHPSRRLLHRADDLVVAGAAAEVARQPPANLLLRRGWILGQQGLRRDEEAGRTDAALKRRALQKALLQRRQALRAADALDGRDLAALHLDG